MTLPASPEVRALIRSFVERKEAELGPDWKRIEADRLTQQIAPSMSRLLGALKAMQNTQWDHKLHSCDDPECYVCQGGLAACDVCGCAEGTLLTFCPGEKVDFATQQLIYSDILDHHPLVGWFDKVKR